MNYLKLFLNATFALFGNLNLFKTKQEDERVLVLYGRRFYKFES